MFFLTNFFSTSSEKLSLTEFQVKKNRLERLTYYYQDKIDYLSSPKIPASLAAIACRDVPLHQTRGTRVSGPVHIKRCLKYYKKKLSKISRELKKLL